MHLEGVGTGRGSPRNRAKGMDIDLSSTDQSVDLCHLSVCHLSFYPSIICLCYLLSVTVICLVWVTSLTPPPSSLHICEGGLTVRNRLTQSWRPTRQDLQLAVGRPWRADGVNSGPSPSLKTGKDQCPSLKTGRGSAFSLTQRLCAFKPSVGGTRTPDIGDGHPLYSVY